LLVLRWPWQKHVKPPKVGGTRAPAEVYRIDFSKPHDFFFRFHFDREELTVFRRCVLVGFTTPEDDAAGGGGYREYSHNRWLVLRREDGRFLYASRDSLLYIEESGTA
jgi:hypothetical protein